MRTVIEDLSVSEIIDKEQTVYPRLDDAFRALTWWLAREPESGIILDDLNWIFKQIGNTEMNIPSLTAIYTFDHRYVQIKFVLVRVPDIQ